MQWVDCLLSKRSEDPDRSASFAFQASGAEVGAAGFVVEAKRRSPTEQEAAGIVSCRYRKKQGFL
jgi:hypothetical protein